MSYGEHQHNYSQVVRAEIIAHETGGETIEIYKQCLCGRVWKNTEPVNKEQYDPTTATE